MSPDKSYRHATSPCKVVSKYFSENLVMDEGSKEIIKEKQSTSKKPQAKTETIQKRPTKRAKGQKDIRTLIKSKKNELLKYSKDFDLICKQSGIDVDPEQLQLAIALSKSLEDNKSTDNDVNLQINNEKSLTCNQRRSKIRTTLQEYGFKTKTAPVQKVKRYRKHHKLILVPNTEKQQRIADKYAEILIKNISIPKVNEESFCNNCINSYLYNLTTNVFYDCIKNDDVFHISDLVPKSLHVKSKFKDWSSIPGRPVSPKLEVLNHNFKNTECSQEELDIILSGPIDVAQDIVKRNHTSYSLKSNNSYIETEINQEIEIKSKDSFTEVLCENKSIKDKLINSTVDDYNIIETMAPPINRSCSPDLFDDEVTIIMESSTDKILVEEGTCDRTLTVNEQNDFMEFTNCIGNYANSKHIACFSQGSNRTRSNSNDFMDLTECIPAYSQKNIQSTGSNDQANKNCSVTKENNQIEVIDLNQSPNLVNNIEASSGSDEKSFDDTIIIIDEDCNINAVNKFNAANATAKDSFIIDLVENQYKSNRILNTTQPKHSDTIVDSEGSPEFNNGSNLERSYRPLSKPDNIKTTDTLNWNSKENSESAKDIENLDTVDLTQPSNFENCLSSLNVSSVQSLALIEIHTELNSNSCDAVNAQNSNNTNESGKDTEEKSERCVNFVEMDLTRSSNSEDYLQDIVQQTSLNNRSLDDTVIINNEHDNLDYLVPNQLERNEIVQEKHHSNVNSNKIHHIIQNKSSTENNVLTIYVTDNDREFDNLVENVSNSKKSNSALFANKFLSDDNFFDELHKSTVENDPNDQQIDLIQNYDCCSDKLSGPNNLSNKSVNVDDGAFSVCDSINDENCVIDVEEQNNKNGTNWNEKSNKREIFLITNQSKAFVDYDSNSEFHVCRDVFKSENKDESNQCQNILNEDAEDVQNSDIDLTQQSHSSEDTCCSSKIIDVPCELGRQYDISIDYDEVCGKAISTKEVEITSSLDTNKYVEKDKNTSKDEGVSNASQQSEVFELSDTEFNYSINQHMQENESSTLKQAKFDIGGLSIIDDFLNRHSLPTTSKLRCSCSSNPDLYINGNEVESCLPVVNNTENASGCNVSKESKSCEEVKFVKIATPLKSKSDDNILIAKTPKHNDYVIKTDQVTPMPNYEKMTSPERNEELDKFGVKPLKRKRAIQILTHIYNQTHPLMEVISNDECSSPSKIRRKNNVESFPRRVIASQIDLITKHNEPSNDILEVLEPNLSQKISKSHKDLPKERKSPKSSSSKENILYEETSLMPLIRNIECSPEDWIFQKREKSKVHSCRVPLHIAFHNHVSSRQALHEAILKYEPINIDDIHKGLVADGYRYNPKDLLKFMDRKCITVKTADNSRKNKNP